MAIRMPMIRTTTISSMRVKPSSSFRRCQKRSSMESPPFLCLHAHPDDARVLEGVSAHLKAVLTSTIRNDSNGVVTRNGCRVRSGEGPGLRIAREPCRLLDQVDDVEHRHVERDDRRPD